MYSSNVPKYERICPLNSFKCVVFFKSAFIVFYEIILKPKNIKYTIVFVLTNTSKYTYVRYHRIYMEICSYLNVP